MLAISKLFQLGCCDWASSFCFWKFPSNHIKSLFFACQEAEKKKRQDIILKLFRFFCGHSQTNYHDVASLRWISSCPSPIKCFVRSLITRRNHYIWNKVPPLPQGIFFSLSKLVSSHPEFGFLILQEKDAQDLPRPQLPQLCRLAAAQNHFSRDVRIYSCDLT
jgi:hypothetical protein